MRFLLSAFAAFFVLTAAGGALAENCGLGLMASLDMTTLPDGRFTVPVSLNGAVYRFMVDTGGTFTKLAPQISSKLGLHEAETSAEIYSVNGKVHMTAASVDSLKLGGIEAKRFHVAVTDDETDPAGGIDGVLEPDLLSQFDIELDFVKGKMNLFSQDHCAGKVVYWTQSGYAELPFKTVSGPVTAMHRINVTTVLDGHEMSTLIDLGSPMSWMLHRVAYQKFGVDENSAGVTLSAFKAKTLPVYNKQFESLSLGALAAPKPVVGFVPDQYERAFKFAHSEKSRDDPIYGSGLDLPDFSLGMDAIRKLHLYIAYKEKKVYVTSADAK